jgi:hypothetical protein
MNCGAFRIWTIASTVALLCALVVRAQQLGEPPRSNAAQPSRVLQQLSVQSLTVDTQDRADVVRFYRTVYRASQGIDTGWNGDVSNCVAGDTTQAYQEATLLRVNYYRAMAGLPADITLNTVWSQKCQQAALMMAAQDGLSHFPTPDWPCYSADGADAAAHSDLALGNAGPEAVDGYLDDADSANFSVGHRRWVLHPPQAQMGTGSIPTIRDEFGGIVYSAANALWVVSDATNRPPTVGFVAWPPGGYVPYPILPQRSGRWSLSYPAADFSRARVTMECSGTNLPLTLELIQNGYGDNTIVWRPKVTNGGQVGTTYSVTVSNFRVAGQARNVNYAVTVIDPDEVRLEATRLPDDHLLLTWPAPVQPYIVEQSVALAAATTWNQLPATPQLTNGIYSLAVPLDGEQHFYRLRQK